ncbi:MAG: ABC transporter permease [Chloroflexi bacterium]|nr:ABC transporter permease [Chloroflexota bacterium]
MIDDLLPIILLSLRVSGTALAISAVIGIPLGAWLGLQRGRWQALAATILYTGMGLPPVVVGLAVYLLLSRSGPLGGLGWLFTPNAMIAAQVIISLPLVAGLTMTAELSVDPALRQKLTALGATPRQVTATILYEARFGVVVGLIAGFGAAISEVGAVMLVGGNIEGQTRVLTTAIVLLTRQGLFEAALILGAILLALTFVANLIVARWQWGDVMSET